MRDDWVIATARETWHQLGWRSLLLVPAAVGIVAGWYAAIWILWALFAPEVPRG